MANVAKTEIRINVTNAVEAMQYWLNNYLLQTDVEIESVEWVSMDGQFKIVIKDTTLTT